MDLSFLVKSAGVKRYVTAGLTVVAGLLTGVPAAAPVLTWITNLAGALGIVGVGHATVAGTIPKAWLATIAAFLAFLIALSEVVPQLQPYKEILQKAAEVIGAMAAGALATSALKTEVSQ